VPARRALSTTEEIPEVDKNKSVRTEKDLSAISFECSRKGPQKSRTTKKELLQVYTTADKCRNTAIVLEPGISRPKMRNLCRDLGSDLRREHKFKMTTRRFQNVHEGKSTKVKQRRAFGYTGTKDQEDCRNYPRAVYEMRKRCRGF
jgi:hypothetical protein